jgi:hypothetical protein
MRVSSRAAVLVALFVVGACGKGGSAGQGGVVLARGVPQVGQKTETAEKIRSPDLKLTITVPGKTIPGSMSMEEDSLSESEVLAVQDGRATKYRLLAKRDSTRTTVRVPNVPAEPTVEDAPLAGVPVIAEWANGKWTRRLEVGEPTAEQAEKLKELWSDADMYTSKPIAVGESWAVEGAALQALAGADCIGTTGEVTANLQSVGACGSDQCATITYSGRIECKMTVGGTLMDVKMSVTGSTQRSLLKFVDLRSNVREAVEMSGDLPDPPGARMAVAGTMETESTTTGN